MEQLGLDFKLIAFQLINFGILFVVLKKFLYAPITGYLERRIKTVSENEELRQTLEKNKKSLDQEKETLEDKNKSKMQEMVKEAKREASAIKRTAEQEAKAEADRILSKAQETASILKDRKTKEAQNTMQSVARETAQDILGDLLTEKQKETFTKAAIKRFVTS